MPPSFSFQQGSERVQNVRYLAESSPLLGRFRAVPRPSERAGGAPFRTTAARDAGAGAGAAAHGAQMGLLSSLGPGWRGSVHVGYGALIAAAAEEDGGGEGEDDELGNEERDGDEWDGEGARWRRRLSGRLKRGLGRLEDTWVDPKAGAIRRVVDVWWSRWATLVVLPALLVSSFSFLD